jgi:hypothetical protein
MRETRRHPWRCRSVPPGGRTSSRPTPEGGRREPPAIRPDRADAEVTPQALQALALCDLVADPRSGITRVTVVGAPPRLVAAVREAAAGCGVIASDQPAEAAGRARVTLNRPPPVGGEAGGGSVD